MRPRWLELWARAGAAGDPAPVFARLVAAYGEAHRVYHTLAHVAACLDEFAPAPVRALAERPEEVELALWFHDVVYRPLGSDNEARSADAFRTAGVAARFDPARIDRVAELILATRHGAAPVTPDARLVVDIDLAILGRSDAEFAVYEAAIQREYVWVPEWLFWRKRAALLRAFRARPTLYATAYFRERYEASARANLAASIARCEAGG
ncbi:MAG: N-methyl-D-aspartate receptor NMDAR2C subunit [Planctomycetes bacterium]|nr:N-methyl-D-aspartate receptor NMDAR2C subunit [Planctomycetota bacterium]